MIFTDDRGEVEGGGVLLDTARWGRPLLKKILECCPASEFMAFWAAWALLAAAAPHEAIMLRSELMEKSCAPNDPRVVV